VLRLETLCDTLSSILPSFTYMTCIQRNIENSYK